MDPLPAHPWGRVGSCTRLLQGAFGHVYLGLLKNGKFMAVKTMEFGESSSNEDVWARAAFLSLSVHICSLVPLKSFVHSMAYLLFALG